jgi:hypothetical protein
VWPGHDADHSPQSSAKVKNELRALTAITSLPQNTSTACSRTALLYYNVVNIPLILELELWNVLNL